MTIEHYRSVFHLKCQVKLIGPGLLCTHYPVTSLWGHARGCTGGVCSRSPWVYNTDSHLWVTLHVLYPKSISLLPENLILYKNMSFFRK